MPLCRENTRTGKQESVVGGTGGGAMDYGIWGMGGDLEKGTFDI